MTDAQQQNEQPQTMAAKPLKEHDALQRLVGQWRTEARMPDGSVEKHEGTEIVRSLGGLWFIAEGHHGKLPDGSDATTIMTIGFDPKQNCYVGTFIGSMMTHLWHYKNGRMLGNTLSLEAEGPRMDGSGGSALYRDSITFENDDHRVLTSEIRGDDGRWQPFMRADYYRT
jgi:hypothetical protein